MAYAGTKTYIDGTVLHRWVLCEPSEQMLAMCAAEELPLDCEARSEYRRQEILGERLLMKRIFGEYTPLQHNSDDEPYVEGCPAHITIAHTRGLLCIGLNAQHRMGIDVERYGRRVLGVRDFFLNDGEKAWLRPDDTLGHMVAWMAKEAIFKAVGVRDIVDDYARDIVVNPFATPGKGQTITHSGSFKGEPYYLETHMGDEFMLTFTCERRHLNKKETQLFCTTI